MLTIIITLLIGILLGVTLAEFGQKQTNRKELDALKERQTAFVKQYTELYEKLVSDTIAAAKAEDEVRLSEASHVIGAIVSGQVYAQAAAGDPLTMDEVVTLVEGYGQFAGYKVADSSKLVAAVRDTVPAEMLRTTKGSGASGVN